MSRGDDKGKLFVGGLSWDTTQASLLTYFSRYGEVTDCVVVMNPATGKSRGFGFVNFKDPSCVETVMAAGPHVLDGKQIDPNGCNRKKLSKVGGKENGRKKLFVGGLPPSVDEQQLRDGFSKYGKVNDVVIVYDQQKQKPRGFGFLTFEDEDSVERVVQERFIQIAGKQVECKRAEPKDLNSTSALGQSFVDQAAAVAGGAMVLAQGPDGSISLVPAHALAAAQTQGHGAALVYPQSAPSAGVGLISPYDLAAYRAATGGMPAELLQAGAFQQGGVRLVQSAGVGGMPGQSYLMMGGNPVSAAGASAASAGGGYFMMSNPSGGGGSILVQAGVPGQSVLMPRSSLNGAVGGGMMMPGGAGGNGYLLAGAGMPQYMMGYPGMTSANLPLAGGATDMAAAYNAGNPYGLPMGYGTPAMYAALGKADQSAGLVAETAADKAANAAGAAAQLSSPYGLGLVGVGGESAEESAARAGAATADGQMVAAHMLGNRLSAGGYYLLPGGTAMYAANPGAAAYAVTSDPSGQTAYITTPAGQASAMIGRMPTAATMSAHGYHPYRR